MPVRSQTHRLAGVEIVSENQLRHVTVHGTNSAPVSDNFSEYFAAPIREPVKAFEFSRSVSFKWGEILNHNRTGGDLLWFRAGAVLQHCAKRPACTVNNQHGHVTSERR